jgi:hypothetical protein
MISKFDKIYRQILLEQIDGFNYIIQPGDNLTKIAKQFNTSIDELCELNNIENPDKIYAGKPLKIKADLINAASVWLANLCNNNEIKGNVSTIIDDVGNVTGITVNGKLKRLAKQGDVSPNQVKEIVKDEINSNFFDMIIKDFEKLFNN